MEIGAWSAMAGRVDFDLTLLRAINKTTFYAIVLLLIVFTGNSALAQTSLASLEIISEKDQFSVGESFSVAVIANTANQDVNAVEYILSYSAKTLQFNEFDSSSTEFEIEAPGAIGSGGTIQMARASIVPVNSDNANISNLNFTATSSGTAYISVKIGSRLLKPDPQSGASINILGAPNSYEFAIIGDGATVDSGANQGSSGDVTSQPQPNSMSGEYSGADNNLQNIEYDADGNVINDDGTTTNGIAAIAKPGGNQMIAAIISASGLALVIISYAYSRYSTRKSGLVPESLTKNSNQSLAHVSPDHLSSTSVPVNTGDDQIDALLNQVHGADANNVDIINPRQIDDK